MGKEAHVPAGTVVLTSSDRGVGSWNWKQKESVSQSPSLHFTNIQLGDSVLH